MSIIHYLATFSFCNVLCLSVFISQGQAQVVSDLTQGTIVSTENQQDFLVTGGQANQGNLFHSFETFSIPRGGHVTFQLPETARNVFGRVTGSSPSNINGTIEVQGNANLFLINPNGYFFGPDAALMLQGSFLASTAESIDFADNAIFSATQNITSPILTVSSPIGLRLTEISQSIEYRANSLESHKLAVQPQQTLALVGSSILLEGGGLEASSGRIELGSLTGPSMVKILSGSVGFSLAYDSVPLKNFRDIDLDAGVSVSTIGFGSGDIQISGQSVRLSSATIAALNLGSEQGGEISIFASDTIELSNDSSVSASPLGTGPGGDINIEAHRLVAQDTLINNAPQPQAASGGETRLIVAEEITLRGFTSITNSSVSAANSGNIIIQTKRLNLLGETRLSNSTFEQGQGGDILIKANESIKVTDSSFIVASTSGFFFGDLVIENAGNIEISTSNLTLGGNAQISVAAQDGSQGTAGNLTINVPTQITLMDQSGLIASAEQTAGGNINIVAGTLRLQDRSKISAEADNLALGGNVSINANLVLAQDNSQIVADAQQGPGGRININAAGIFQSLDSTISAISIQNPMLNGEVNIEVETDPSRGLTPLEIELPTPADQISQGCSAPGQNRFFVTGRGGPTPTAQETFNRSLFWTDLRLPTVTRTAESAIAHQHPPQPAQPWVEAQGWVIGAKGQLMLTAPTPAPNAQLATHACDGQTV